MSHSVKILIIGSMGVLGRLASSAIPQSPVSELVLPKLPNASIRPEITRLTRVEKMLPERINRNRSPSMPAPGRRTEIRSKKTTLR